VVVARTKLLPRARVPLIFISNQLPEAKRRVRRHWNPSPSFSLVGGGGASYGGHSTVYLGQRKGGSGERVAVKSSAELSLFLREARALVCLRGVSGIVRLLDFCEWSGGFALVLPELVSVDFEFLQQHASECAAFFGSLLRTLGAAHALGVAHCDIKPDALMYNAASRPVLTDFNLARGATESLHGVLPGTPGWVLDGSDCSTGSDVDRVGLASVIGWVLGVQGCGDAEATLAQVRHAFARHLNSETETVRLALLRVGHLLLSSGASLVDLASSLSSSTVRAETKRTQVVFFSPFSSGSTHLVSRSASAFF
jgi:hypothetical protein